ncbi:hypothetical protein L484_025303 [Morus notabilis]|uniref:Uncharacterized protein n=1 Tax=Morus notabilis TaxID=981085 RepID=W9RUA2_9ROSA|nr:hypothetical protein L484_025303 [Morus notabilis]
MSFLPVILPGHFHCCRHLFFCHKCEKSTCGRDQSNEQQEDGTADKTDNGGSRESRWQRQEAATFADPSSLFSFFQSQCMIVNPAQ